MNKLVKYGNPYFNPAYIRKAVGFKLWEKFLLFFIPCYVAIDTTITDKRNVAVFYKTLFGKVYIVGEEYLPTLTSFKHKGKIYKF